MSKESFNQNSDRSESDNQLQRKALSNLEAKSFVSELTFKESIDNMSVDDLIPFENPENLSADDFILQLNNEIIELRMDIGALKNRVSAGEDPYRLSDEYNRISQEITEREEKISLLNDTKLRQEYHENALSEREKEYLEKIRDLEENQDSSNN
jgi:uncharacterized membrane protein